MTDAGQYHRNFGFVPKPFKALSRNRGKHNSLIAQFELALHQVHERLRQCRSTFAPVETSPAHASLSLAVEPFRSQPSVRQGLLS